MSNPLVSIVCTTFNHKSYIVEAIEGFLMQQASFEYELLIHDDCSTDGTIDILKEYQQKYPTLIRLILQPVNVYSQGKKIWPIAFAECKGRYIALCEGDDYWVDPNKLQKQVDFLLSNPDFTFCFHDSWQLNQDSGVRKKRIFPRVIDSSPDLISVLVENNVPTASLVFRNLLDYQNLPSWFHRSAKGDYSWVVLLAERGRGRFLPDTMAVYRIHSQGIWSGKTIEYFHRENMLFYNYLLDYFGDKTIKNVIRQKIKFIKFNYAISLLRLGFSFHALSLILSNYFLSSDSRIQPNLRKALRALFGDD